MLARMSNAPVNESLPPPTIEDWHAAEHLLKDWLRRARENQHTHFEASTYFNNLNWYLSLPVVGLTAILGTSAFASIQKDVGDEWKIAFGVLGLIAAALAAIQANLKFAERSERHQRVAAGYGSIRREIEETLVLPVSSRRSIPELLASVRSTLGHLASESPDVPRKIWERALKVAERDRQITRDELTEYDKNFLDKLSHEQSE